MVLTLQCADYAHHMWLGSVLDVVWTADRKAGSSALDPLAVRVLTNHSNAATKRWVRTLTPYWGAS